MSQDLNGNSRRTTEWIKIVLMVAIPTIINAIALAYHSGQITAELSAIEKRLDAYEQAVEATRLNVARLCQRPGAGCKE